MSAITINPPLHYVDQKLIQSTQSKTGTSSENILFSIDVTSGIGIISQLSEVSRYTNQIFGRIVSKTSNLSTRISNLKQRILTIEEQYPQIENKLYENQDIGTLFNNEIEPTIESKQNDLSLQTMPRSEYVQSLYENTHPDPDFKIIENTIGEDLNLMQYYSNLAFIKEPAKEKKKKEKKIESQNQSSRTLLSSSDQSSSTRLLSKQDNVSYSNILDNGDNPFDVSTPLDDMNDDFSFDDAFGDVTVSKPKKQTQSLPTVSEQSGDNEPIDTQEPHTQSVSQPPNDLFSAIRSFDRSKLHKTETTSNTETSNTSISTPPTVSKPASTKPSGGMSTDIFAQIRSFDRSKLHSVKEEENETTNTNNSTSQSSTPASNPQQDILSAIKNFKRSNLKPVTKEEPTEGNTPQAGNPQSDILRQIAGFDRSKLNKVNIEEEKEKRQRTTPVNPMDNMLKEIMAKRFALLNTQNSSSSESEDSEWSE